MKKKLLVVLCALLIGGGSAYYLFNKVVVKASDTGFVTVKAFQVGAFTKYENAYKVAERNNGIVISDEDIYRVYIAVLSDDKAIDVLKQYYMDIGLNYYLKDIIVSEDFVKSINISEEMLKQSSTETYATINMEILKKYKEML